eukprot:scaffold155_cov347-Pavlova_lutheri.AAC.63
MDAAEDQFDAGPSYAKVERLVMGRGREKHVVRDACLVHAYVRWHLHFHVLQEQGHHLVAFGVDD